MELRKVTTFVASEKWKGGFDLAKHLITTVCVIGCVYIIFHTFSDLAQAKPDSLRALATFAATLKMDKLFPSIFGALGIGGWIYERRGKKRAIKKIDGLRQQIERDDKYNQSSGLDDAGHTPKSGRKS